MKWVVDTCVIIDILSGDEEFARPSALACDAKRDFGLIAAPITYIELAPSWSLSRKGATSDCRKSRTKGMGM